MLPKGVALSSKGTKVGGAVRQIAYSKFCKHRSAHYLFDSSLPYFQKGQEELWAASVYSKPYLRLASSSYGRMPSVCQAPRQHSRHVLEQKKWRI